MGEFTKKESQKPLSIWLGDSESLYEVNGGLKINILEEYDVYFQKDTFRLAYEEVTSILINLKKQGVSKLKEFKAKLLDCELVVLINEEQNQAHPVEQIFLDINEKSHLLDEEDIFKGHCFKNFENNHIQELRAQWIKLKKCGARFSEINYEDLGQYIYLYLLITNSTKIKENLHQDGKHYLEGKTIDETSNLLNDMIIYGEAVTEFYDNLCRTDYKFEDLCSGGNTERYINGLQELKGMMRKLMNEKAQYQKLPLFYFVYCLHKDTSLKKLLSYQELRTFLSDLYISGMLFVHSTGRKGKSDIDYTVRDVLTDKIVEKQKLLNAAKELRKKRMEEYSLSYKKHDEGYIAFLSSVIDGYDHSARCLFSDYCLGDYNIEHFLMPNHKSCIIQWKTEQKELEFDIPVRKTLALKYKSLFGNYLWMNQELNRELHNYDVVFKIKHITEWYEKKNKKIPCYMGIIIKYISDLKEYKSLALYKANNEADQDKIGKKYFEFLEKYFSDDCQQELASRIHNQLIKSFH